jgi:hypothetical protein
MTGGCTALISRKYLSARQAAQRLKCVPATIERLALAGAFPGAVRAKGFWRIPASDIERQRARSKGIPAAIAPALVRRPTDFFECPKGGGALFARICVARQQLAERQTPSPGKDKRHHKGNAMRGVAPRFVFCRSTSCPDGRRIRMILGELEDHQAGVRRGYTLRPDGWDQLPPAQAAAAARLAAVGLLDEVPTMDRDQVLEATG